MPAKMSKDAVAAAPANDFEIMPTSDHNATALLKANKRVAMIWTKWGKPKGSRSIIAESILVSENNRIPNMPYAHCDLAPGIMKDGFDSGRAQKGWVVELSNADDINALIAYNNKLAEGSDLYPPIIAELVKYACLAGNHLTIVFRLFKSSKKSSINGKTFSAPAEDEFLADVLENGHEYYVLDQKTPVEDQVFLARWKNTDQNQNQFAGMCEHLSHIQSVCAVAIKECPHVRVSTIVAKIASESMVKLTPAHISNIATYCISMGNGKYVEEFITFASANINPKELTFSSEFLAKLISTIGKDYQLLIQAILSVHASDTSCVVSQVRPSVSYHGLVAAIQTHTWPENRWPLHIVYKQLY